MRLVSPGARYPKLYQAFTNSQEIADVINRSPRYVKKALKRGFTEKEKQILINFKKQKDLFEESV